MMLFCRYIRHGELSFESEKREGTLHDGDPITSGEPLSQEAQAAADHKLALSLAAEFGAADAPSSGGGGGGGAIADYLARTTIQLTLPAHCRSGDNVHWTGRGGKKQHFTVLPGYRGRDVMPCDVSAVDRAAARAVARAAAPAVAARADALSLSPQVTVVCKGADIQQFMTITGANLDVARQALLKSSGELDDATANFYAKQDTAARKERKWW